MVNRIFKHTLEFKVPSGTSRGVLRTKDSWDILLEENNKILAIGEASIIENLSPENPDEMTKKLDEISCGSSLPSTSSIPVNLPSVRFALEMIHKGMETQNPFLLYDNPFSNGKKGIPINGLIWMGDKQFMFDQIKRKLAEGYACIKLKIGAINFEEEMALLSYVRQQYSSDEISLRVDANGAFSPTDALEKLKRLSDLDIHSIEQPIKQGQWNEMAYLCANTPIDIALDEELIGVTTTRERQALLQTIGPQYIILKPSLIGGWKTSEEWIRLAQESNIKWWVTSALESNIGLNAIAQWVGSISTTLPQGLGTGALYNNNISSPLYIKDAQLWYDPQEVWDRSFFNE